MNTILKSYEEAWQTVIKPSRLRYSTYNLGLSIEQFNDDFQINRHDFDIKIDRDILPCSIFYLSPDNIDNPKPAEYIKNTNLLIYLHSQSASRLEGLFLKAYLDKFSLLLFDFSGCGLTKGEYVTLGYKESQDLEIIVNYVVQNFSPKKISLYGRSMGAATALFYIKRNSFMVNSVILDSPFSCVETMIKDVAFLKLGLPGFIVGIALKLIEGKIIEKVHFNVLNLKPIEASRHTNVPVLFIIGEKDELVRPNRIKEIYDCYLGTNKHIVYSKGGHADEREDYVINQALNFLVDNFNTNIQTKNNKLEHTFEIGHHSYQQIKELEILGDTFSSKMNELLKKKEHNYNEDEYKSTINNLTTNKTETIIDTNNNYEMDFYGNNYKYDDGFKEFNNTTNKSLNIDNISVIQNGGESLDYSMNQLLSNIIPNIKDELYNPKNKN